MPLDPETAGVYARHAEDYQRSRPPIHADRARALQQRAPGPVLDLGCGPGGYLPALGGESIALDAVPAMLDVVDHPRRVRADLARLPFRPRSIRGAWARNSYVHTPHAALPLALAELHRATAVGAPVVASFLGAEDDDVRMADDDLPGRRFWRYRDETLVDTFLGAGFDQVVLSGDRPRFVDAVRVRTLPDTVGPHMRILVCGLNPSLHAADAGVGFVTPSNRFWRAATEAGIVSRDRDPWHALRAHGTGMTDLVKRATTRADELSHDEYRTGVERVERLCARLRPGVVVMVGLAGWRAAVDRRAVAGLQDRELGGRPVYVMPSTSGLNARSRLTDLVTHLRTASTLAGG